jgi:hypothetical protein
MAIMTHPTTYATAICPDGTDSGELQELGCTQVAGQATIARLITRDICQAVIQA